ncbi:MAG: sigma-70 family RNA polymerase sigma factor [Planctomycetaceae bacterium]|nr:sigma-70 family RNA polymerase sigma factor [Planctomycetaceae bacterium]
MPADQSPQFATTRWSLIRDAGHNRTSTARTALEELCRQYWFPVYAFIRRQGNSAADAEDLTQAFFVYFLESAFVKAADRDRGRFRSFLLKSVSNFVKADHRARASQKHGGTAEILSLDFASGEQQYGQLAADTATPVQLFERRWAMTVLQKVAHRLRSEYEQRNHSLLYTLLEPHMNQSAERLPYEQLCEPLNMSEEAVRQTVRRMKLRYRELLRAEIAGTVASPSEIDDELRTLLNALAVSDPTTTDESQAPD